MDIDCECGGFVCLSAPSLSVDSKAHSSFPTNSYPRWWLARNRRLFAPGLTRMNLHSCFVMRPWVRARHILNDFADISIRINFTTSPGDRLNWLRIASKLVRSSQAIMMMRSMSPRVSLTYFSFIPLLLASIGDATPCSRYSIDSATLRRPREVAPP